MCGVFSKRIMVMGVTVVVYSKMSNTVKLNYTVSMLVVTNWYRSDIYFFYYEVLWLWQYSELCPLHPFSHFGTKCGYFVVSISCSLLGHIVQRERGTCICKMACPKCVFDVARKCVSCCWSRSTWNIWRMDALWRPWTVCATSWLLWNTTLNVFTHLARKSLSRQPASWLCGN